MIESSMSPELAARLHDQWRRALVAFAHAGGVAAGVQLGAMTVAFASVAIVVATAQVFAVILDDVGRVFVGSVLPW